MFRNLRVYVLVNVDDDVFSAGCNRKRANPLSRVAHPSPDIHSKTVKRALDRRAIEFSARERPTGVRTAIVDRSNPIANSEDAD